MTHISIVAPTFNEEKNIEIFIKRIRETLSKINNNYEILFILDPCTDNTENILQDYSSRDKKIKIIKMSRRFGQPAATIAGINNSKGDYIVIIDSDLQDPPELIEDMYKKILNGFDVIYAKRKNRDGETYIKKFISKLGYRLINFFSDIEIPPDVGDFRIISKRVANQISNFQEKNLI